MVERKYLSSNLNINKLYSLQRKCTKTTSNVVVRGELHYKSDIATAQNICQRNKDVSHIRPQQLPSIVPLNKDKLSDVKKLLLKHFGPEWENMPNLFFYKNVFETQQILDAPQIEENYCQELMDEVQDLRV
ncbi:unnamed protein product [Diatraea saccharalis]|uniref:Uncharacterized protein n=1 Tax=Diatraea saccharalis TaxID=40085 RepID=A0A9N9WHI5_9NEOP|nr:unnamed protein product [Diatraea saccharalis]